MSASAFRMERVVVIGSSGAGKSHFAARLAQRTGLPLVHLDAVYGRPGWAKPDPGEWVRTVRRLTAGERWIIDGNYAGTMDQRLAACDTAIFLDPPRALCLRRAVQRRIRFHGRARPDLTRGCPERLTREFIRWIWQYPGDQRPKVLRRLSALRPDQRAVIFRSPAEVETFLRSVP